MKLNHSSIQDLCMIGVVTAVIAIMAQIAIPLPLGVPMTMQTFAITLAGIILGAKKGAYASLVYILIGAIGLPVFSNFTGGYQSLIGPVGGFILSFPLMAFLIGLGTELKQKRNYFYTLFLIIGTILNLLCGLLLFCIVTQSSLFVGFTTCVLPFIPTAIIKAVIASMLGFSIKKHIIKAKKY